jgi:hypothetical protein
MRHWLVLFLLLTSSGSVVARPSVRAITAAPLALDPGDPAHVTLGALRYLRGWVLTSNDPRFGGLSSLRIRGNRIHALSDSGWLFAFDHHGSRFSAPRDIPLRDRNGALTINRMLRDSEAMTFSPDGGTIWIGLEEMNAIWRYGDPAAAAEATILPMAMRHWPMNSSIETLLRLRDGRFLVLSEDGDGPQGADGPRDALLFDRDPTDPKARITRFGYRPPAGFKATDAAQLPDGRVLVLNRRFTTLDGVGAAVTVIDPAAIAPGATLAGEEIARLAPPLSVDNMEGIDVTAEAGQPTI